MTDQDPGDDRTPGDPSSDPRSSSVSSGPIDEAIATVVEGLGPDDATTLVMLIRAGLDAMDTTASNEWLAEHEIAPAADLEPSARLDWGRAFAAAPEVNRLNSDAWNLVRSLVDGTRPPRELAAEAQTRLEQVDAETDTLPAPLLRKRNEAIADLRWVAGLGEGPASLRAGRYRRKEG